MQPRNADIESYYRRLHDNIGIKCVSTGIEAKRTNQLERRNINAKLAAGPPTFEAKTAQRNHISVTSSESATAARINICSWSSLDGAGSEELTGPVGRRGTPDAESSGEAGIDGTCSQLEEISWGSRDGSSTI
ncbi:unnamed protein product [Phytophthora fragariaefolia]|uniref:Unnamed protein product n=1 Tax=Phytophthora fragariaefolia TaxID=1490495 RepID=A0A9W6Y7W2_9STRA|nr:unnamed protein product [Phytophthora fragariaefolia]